MIPLDPVLGPDAKPDSALSATETLRLPAGVRLPSSRALVRYVAEVQRAIRLRGQVSILLTSDRGIRRLNRRFRGKDRPTDVLSFPAERSLAGAEKMAGDLAISLETALRQAAEQGHALSTEIKLLLLHGLLHLAGYDHEADQGQMARREFELRRRLGLKPGLIERLSTPRKVESIRGRFSESLRPAAAGKDRTRPGTRSRS
jgi:probable rRNA maturation factor